MVKRDATVISDIRFLSVRRAHTTPPATAYDVCMTVKKKTENPKKTRRKILEQIKIIL